MNEREGSKQDRKKEGEERKGKQKNKGGGGKSGKRGGRERRKDFKVKAEMQIGGIRFPEEGQSR